MTTEYDDSMEWDEVIAAGNNIGAGASLFNCRLALCQLCVNNGGSVSIPMLPAATESFSGNLILQGRVFNGSWEFRVIKRTSDMNFAEYRP